MAPSEANLRLTLSLVAAAGANVAGYLGDHPPSGWQWVKIVISTVVVVVVNWRAFVTNPSKTTTDPAATEPISTGTGGAAEKPPVN